VKESTKKLHCRGNLGGMTHEEEGISLVSNIITQDETPTGLN